MKKHFNLTEWALLLLALGLFMMPRAGSAQSTTTALNLGDVLPDVSGQTPSGGSLRLSDVIAAKASVVVVFVQQDCWQGCPTVERPSV